MKTTKTTKSARLAILIAARTASSLGPEVEKKKAEARKAQQSSGFGSSFGYGYRGGRF